MIPSEVLQGRRLIVVGAGSHVGRRLAQVASEAGAEVILCGPDADKLKATAAELSGEHAIVRVDLADEASIEALAAQTDSFDHLVSTAAMPANGPVSGLDLAAIRRAFDAKVVGPLALAKHLAAKANPGGSLTFFSGVAAWRPAPERVVMATTNGAVSFMAEALAVELAPIRVNAISPGIVDTGAWDRLGSGKDAFLKGVSEKNLTRSVGAADDLIEAVFYLIGNRYVTGTVLHVDGGGRLV